VAECELSSHACLPPVLVTTSERPCTAPSLVQPTTATLLVPFSVVSR
jgi:hypothetical protein